MDHFKGATWSEFASFMNKVSQMAFRPKLPLLSHPYLAEPSLFSNMNLLSFRRLELSLNLQSVF